MEIIKNPNIRIEKKIKIDFDKSTNFRWLTYLYAIKLDGDLLIYNMLTTGLIKVSQEEYDRIFIDEELSDKLKKMLFIVPDNYPDYKIYKYFFKYFNKSKISKITLNGQLCAYTILSTLNCNARCYYCYEKPYGEKGNMSKETLEYTIRLIKENYNINHNKVHITLFGGEPLFNYKVYDQIFNALKEDDIPYSSDFISNGYLITQSMIDKMKDLYHIKKGQITIDGTKDNYNRIKNYIYKKDNNPYQTVINNIHNLLKNDIKVDIRINFDPNDIEDKIKLYEILSKEFREYEEKELISIYLHELFIDYDKENQIKIINILDNFNRKYYWHKDIFLINHCMADSINSIVITPNGDLYSCEHMPRGASVGNINDYYNKGQDLDKQKYIDTNFTYYEFEECKNCIFKPECITYKYCPESFEGKECSLILKYRITRKVQDKIYTLYDNYLKNNSKENTNN